MQSITKRIVLPSDLEATNTQGLGCQYMSAWRMHTALRQHIALRSSRVALRNAMAKRLYRDRHSYGKQSRLIASLSSDMAVMHKPSPSPPGQNLADQHDAANLDLAKANQIVLV